MAKAIDSIIVSINTNGTGTITDTTVSYTVSDGDLTKNGALDDHGTTGTDTVDATITAVVAAVKAAEGIA